MTRLDRIPPYDDERAVRVVVEAPKGAVVKLKFEPQLGAFTVSRPLPVGSAYPFDWGFVPGTLAADGDPLDALVLDDHATFPGVVIPCRLIGVVEVEQRSESGLRERNDRLILVPGEARWLGELKDVKSLPKPLKEEIERFFLNVTFFTAKDPRILGWRGHDSADEILARGIRAFRRTGKGRSGGKAR